MGAAALAAAVLLAGVVAGLAGCGSTPPRTGGSSTGGSSPPPRPGPAPAGERDGPGSNPPPDLHLVPDAEPRVELIRPGGPNKPYTVLGRSYTPQLGDPVVVERGGASWYGRKFHGRQTSNGEVYDMYAMTAAHKTMPLPSYAKVRNPANGREVVVRVNDRGPFHSDRVIDLSYTAALRLGLLGGVAPVEVERITHEAIRTGNWRPPDAATGLATAPARRTPVATAAAPPVVTAAAAPRPAAPASPASPAVPAARPAPPTVLPEPAGPAATPLGGPIVEAAASADPIGVFAQRAAAGPGPGPAATTAPAPADAGGFWLQLGAFRDANSAAGLQQRLAREADWLAPLLAVFSEPRLHRLQAGPYASRQEALAAAERLRTLLSQAPALVERR